MELPGKFWNTKLLQNKEMVQVFLHIKFNSKTLIHDLEVKPRNIRFIEDCELRIIDLADLRN